MIEILISYIRNIKNYYFPNKNPFGKRILASKEDYLSIFNEAKNIKYTDIDKLENENGFKVEKCLIFYFWTRESLSTIH